MRRLGFILCFVMCIAAFSTVEAQTKEKRPLVVIYQIDSAESAFPITAALSEQIEQTKRADSLVYQPSEPFIQRLVAEGSIDKNLAIAAPNATQQLAISAALGAQASLQISAQLVEDTVQVTPSKQIAKKTKNKQPVKFTKNMTLRISAVWKATNSNQTWQNKFDSPVIYRGSNKEIDRISTARTAASTLSTKLVAEPLNGTAMIEAPTKETSTPAPAAVAPESPAEPTGDTSSLSKQNEEAGDRALQAGDLALAIAKYRDAISLQPLQPAPRAKLINAYLKLKMDTEALNEAKRATELIGAVSELAGPLADAYVSADQPEEAEKLFRQMLDKDPSNVQIALRLVDVLWNNGRLNEAETLLKKTLDAAKDHYEPYMKLAHLYALKNQFTDAANMVTQIYKLVPDTDETTRSDIFGSLVADLYPSIQKICQLSTDAIKSQKDKKTTREQLYNELTTHSNEAEKLYGYVSGLVPTPQQITQHEGYKLSCVLLKNGLATLTDAITNNDAAQQTEGETSIGEALREAISAGKQNTVGVH